MKSLKKVKELSEIIKPYVFTPKETIEGSINGKSYYFPRGKECVITPAQFQALLDTNYGEQLKD